MIDCENEVYTKVAQALRTAHSGINITGDYTNVPSSFPHVCITQIDSVKVRYDSDEGEMTEVTFKAEIYSNAKSGKKTEAKKIARTVDEAFRKMNFRRMSLNPIPNTDDPTIYRLVGAYEAKTDGTFFYRS